MTFYSDVLAQLRQQHTYTYEELGKKLGVSKQAVSAWEKGKATPRIKTVLQMARLFGVPYTKLCCGAFDVVKTLDILSSNNSSISPEANALGLAPIVGKAEKVIHHASSAQELSEAKRKVFDDILDAVMASDRLEDEAKIIMYDIIKQQKQKYEEIPPQK
ncbi:MAG TPA: helix-turn-helix transcriptional regulator [Victivallis vadensis]|nr:helix-turn-helix transcriptional regulator [Victivallis vadensis]